jgi:hypothetical protein
MERENPGGQPPLSPQSVTATNCGYSNYGRGAQLQNYRYIDVTAMLIQENKQEIEFGNTGKWGRCKEITWKM